MECYYTWVGYKNYQKETQGTDHELPTYEQVVLNAMKKNGSMRRDDIVGTITFMTRVSRIEVQNNIHTLVASMERQGLIHRAVPRGCIVPTHLRGVWVLGPEKQVDKEKVDSCRSKRIANCV